MVTVCTVLWSGFSRPSTLLHKYQQSLIENMLSMACKWHVSKFGVKNKRWLYLLASHFLW